MYQLLIFTAILSTAMLAGLMTTLLIVMRPMWRQQTDDVAARSLRDFLRHASTNRILITVTNLPAICAIVIGFLGAPARSGYAFALAGGGVFLVGFLVCTALVNLPIYRAVLRWNLESDAEPARQEVRRALRRFHRSNVIRLGSALAASALFFLAA
jgi:uncharacterized membrane protein